MKPKDKFKSAMEKCTGYLRNSLWLKGQKKRETSPIWVSPILVIIILGVWAVNCWAAPEMATFKSALVWRADGQGDYNFKDAGRFSGTAVAEDGSVVFTAAPGKYEIKTPYTTDGLIWSITATWSFTGKATMELSATGNSADYIRVINGVPVEWKAFRPGSRLIWRITLAPESSLTEVKINYTDISGVLGGFGTPELTGFEFRKPIYIRGSPSAELFNFQLPIKVGESSRVEGCDAYVKGVIQSDFDDVRFTLKDKETLIPYWRESLTGAPRNRAAAYWLRVPQIPAEGLVIYIYYGKQNAAGLSNGEAVFDFFDSFENDTLNPQKWAAYNFTKGIIEYKTKEEPGTKTLDTSEMTTADIVGFFLDVEAFDWVRARKSVDSPPTVDKDNTEKAAEEVPNLPHLRGVNVGANGDLVLEEGEIEGEYVSALIHSPFTVRIMVPGWEAAALQKNSIAVDISANGGATYKEDCNKEEYYYASKKDFTPGGAILLRARFSRQGGVYDAPSLKELNVDFRPGAITLVSPDGGEIMMPDDKYEITWTAWEYEPSYEMALAYSLDGGETYYMIAETTENDGRYIWRVPDAASQRAVIQIYDALDDAVFDTSNDYFSIGFAPEEEELEELEELLEPPEELEEEPVLGLVEVPEEALIRPGTKPHELVIKIGDSAGYKDGDIIMIKPAGFLWGAEEKTKFLIVQAYLTEEEATELMKPKAEERVDSSGRVAKRIIKRRRYRLDLTRLGYKDRNMADMHRYIKGMLVGIEDLKDKDIAEKDR